MFEMNWKVWAAIAAVVSALAAALYWFGLIPWWGILIAVPAVTVVAVTALLVIGILMWMAGGSH